MLDASLSADAHPAVGPPAADLEIHMRRLLFPVLAAAALITFAIVAGCSGKSSSPTAPGGGGGGGGTSATIHSGNIAPNGGSFSFTFPDSGTTNYHCSLHAAMQGNSITVTSGSANDSVVVQIVSATTPGYSPSSANVKPGGTVRWVNVHTMTHTVDND